MRYLAAVLVSCLFISFVFYRLSFLGPDRSLDKIATISLEHLKDTAQCGDLLLFSGNGVDSAIVKAWSGNSWSHVAMIYLQGSKLYVWHSDAVSFRKDVRDGEYREGTQLNDLEAFLKTYNGCIFHLPLHQPLRTSDMEAVMRAVGIREFNHNLVELLRCTTGGDYSCTLLDWETSHKHMFCSELTALTLYHCGALGDKLPFSQYHPSSFLGYHKRCDWSPEYEPKLSDLRLIDASK